MELTSNLDAGISAEGNLDFSIEAIDTPNFECEITAYIDVNSN